MTSRHEERVSFRGFQVVLDEGARIRAGADVPLVHDALLEALRGAVARAVANLRNLAVLKFGVSAFDIFGGDIFYVYLYGRCVGKVSVLGHHTAGRSESMVKSCKKYYVMNSNVGLDNYF